MARILVVDDSWLIRQTVTNFLKRAGHEVILAENGRLGLEKCLAEKPDCMILDLLMPDMGGIEVLCKLKELSNTTPVMVLSADIQHTTQDKCKEAGAREFLLKPPNEEHFFYKVNQILESRKA